MVDEFFVTEQQDLAAVLASRIAEVVEIHELDEALHALVRFPAREAGRSETSAPIGFNQRRRIIVRTPVGYDPALQWPLLVAYHSWGGTADRMIDRLESHLGDDIDRFVVAAPDDYRQTIIDAPPPVSAEHVSVWRELRSKWHIDADRTHLIGYSLGAETVLTTSTFHPSHVASGVAMVAGVSHPSDIDGLWEAFQPNLLPVPILHSWGTEDTLNIPGLNGRPQDVTLAEQNERLDTLLMDHPLPLYRHVRIDGAGHGDAFPSAEDVLHTLSIDRSAEPASFRHTFRYIHQAAAHWVEGHEWDGEAWLTPWPIVSAHVGESEEAALERTIFELLGTIDARIEGQHVTVSTTHLSELTVWLDPDLVSLDEPITLTVNGDTLFEGTVTPSVSVALMHARRLYDFERLRSAGVRVDLGTGTASIVTAETSFPPIARGVTF